MRTGADNLPRALRFALCGVHHARADQVTGKGSSLSLVGAFTSSMVKGAPVSVLGSEAVNSV